MSGDWVGAPDGPTETWHRHEEHVAALAAAEQRGRQWAIDTLRDTHAYDAWVRRGMRDGSRYRSQWGAGDVIYAADYVVAMATEEANRDET